MLSLLGRLSTTFSEKQFKVFLKHHEYSYIYLDRCNWHCVVLVFECPAVNIAFLDWCVEFKNIPTLKNMTPAICSIRLHQDIFEHKNDCLM